MHTQSFTDGTVVWWATRLRITKRPIIKTIEITRFEPNHSTDASQPDMIEIHEHVPVTVYEFEIENF